MRVRIIGFQKYIIACLQCQNVIWFVKDIHFIYLYKPVSVFIYLPVSVFNVTVRYFAANYILKPKFWFYSISWCYRLPIITSHLYNLKWKEFCKFSIIILIKLRIPCTLTNDTLVKWRWGSLVVRDLCTPPPPRYSGTNIPHFQPFILHCALHIPLYLSPLDKGVLGKAADQWLFVVLRLITSTLWLLLSCKLDLDFCDLRSERSQRFGCDSLSHRYNDIGLTLQCKLHSRLLHSLNYKNINSRLFVYIK